MSLFWMLMISRVRFFMSSLFELSLLGLFISPLQKTSTPHDDSFQVRYGPLYQQVLWRLIPAQTFVFKKYLTPCFAHQRAGTFSTLSQSSNSKYCQRSPSSSRITFFLYRTPFSHCHLTPSGRLDLQIQALVENRRKEKILFLKILLQL